MFRQLAGEATVSLSSPELSLSYGNGSLIFLSSLHVAMYEALNVLDIFWFLNCWFACDMHPMFAMLEVLLISSGMSQSHISFIGSLYT